MCSCMVRKHADAVDLCRRALHCFAGKRRHDVHVGICEVYEHDVVEKIGNRHPSHIHVRTYVNMQGFWDDNRLTDVILHIVVDTVCAKRKRGDVRRSLILHAAVLAGHSDYFATRLMKPVWRDDKVLTTALNELTVHVDDREQADALQAVLRFCYTGQAADLPAYHLMSDRFLVAPVPRYEVLWGDKWLSDFQLDIISPARTHTIHLHAVVLAATLERFKAVFMKRGRPKRMVIIVGHDQLVSAVEAVMRICYTGTQEGDLLDFMNVSVDYNLGGALAALVRSFGSDHPPPIPFDVALGIFMANLPGRVATHPLAAELRAGVQARLGVLLAEMTDEPLGVEHVRMLQALRMNDAETVCAAVYSTTTTPLRYDKLLPHLTLPAMMHLLRGKFRARSESSVFTMVNVWMSMATGLSTTLEQRRRLATLLRLGQLPRGPAFSLLAVPWAQLTATQAQVLTIYSQLSPTERVGVAVEGTDWCMPSRTDWDGNEWQQMDWYTAVPSPGTRLLGPAAFVNGFRAQLHLTCDRIGFTLTPTVCDSPRLATCVCKVFVATAGEPLGEPLHEARVVTWDGSWSAGFNRGGLVNFRVCLGGCH